MGSGGLPALLVVLSGPSGVGKTTIGELLLERVPDLVRIVTATTRAPRDGEQNGRDYHFWTDAEFRDSVGAGRMLEWAEVNGNHYGTPLGAVAEALMNGRVVLLNIDIDGARQVRKVDDGALTIFLEPPGHEELERRLRDRATEDEERIHRRMARVRRELEAAGEYDARVVNDELESCVERVAGLIHARRMEMAGSGVDGYPGLRKLKSRLAGRAGA